MIYAFFLYSNSFVCFFVSICQHLTLNQDYWCCSCSFVSTSSNALDAVGFPLLFGSSQESRGHIRTAVSRPDISSPANDHRHLPISTFSHPALLLKKQFYMQMLHCASLCSFAIFQIYFGIEDELSSIFLVFFYPIWILCFSCWKHITHIFKLFLLVKCFTNRSHCVFNGNFSH